MKPPKETPELRAAKEKIIEICGELGYFCIIAHKPKGNETEACPCIYVTNMGIMENNKQLFIDQLCGFVDSAVEDYKQKENKDGSQ